ncbi:hypothetical protein INP83_11865 [Mucilaginibacter sp. 21P]|uniref:XAC2610-related protein n=1 Tax=Mucilaginibacter sp. 21P TaxID=2778902 RepID=UPI001C5835C2|nr:hypothetical protein [Mucilaginibacter sp. 21P]QXV63802.1 hypothetical protein INP83_11865 [Mucilaginibacter sp. 21P]
MRKATYIFTLALLSLHMVSAYAQTCHLRSVNQTKPFGLQLYYGTDGKAAFVQYDGQTGIIPLKLIRVTKGPTEYYQWAEIVKAQKNGTYQLTVQQGKVSNAFYERARDKRRFDLAEVTPNTDETVGKLLLHDILITYPVNAAESRFWLNDAAGKGSVHITGSVDAINAIRKSYVMDVNFDGYDDLAFSIPDAGMGVYQTFNIWLYDPRSKRFKALQPPNDKRSKCDCLCDVTLDQQKKLIITSCRGGARWWKDSYRITDVNRLIRVDSKEIKGNEKF